MQKGRRYAYKNFIEFKKQVSLEEKGYEMYTANFSENRNKVRRKQQKAKANKSGRRTRLTGQDQPKKSRKVSETRRKIFDLTKKHPTITINAGDPKSNISKAATPEVAPIDLYAIQALVKNMNTAKRLAQLATDLFFMKILEKLPLDGAAHMEKRKELFEPVLYGKNAGKHYFQTLLGPIARNDGHSEHLRKISNQLLEGINDDGDEPMPEADKSDDGDEVMEEIMEEDDDDENEEEDDDEQEYDDNSTADINEKTSRTNASHTEKYMNPSLPKTCTLIAFQLLKDCHKDYAALGAISSRSIQMLSQTLHREFASHLKGRIPLLLEKVKY
ncbi:hypothetical protein BGW37DRAFT_118494 [Umbelopsis sp. PMI_123]|nr:hypothetical protein BGW37DRAFT_118494 [Umbelopsis sp. PMI_123]